MQPTTSHPLSRGTSSTPLTGYSTSVSGAAVSSGGVSKGGSSSSSTSSSGLGSTGGMSAAAKRGSMKKERSIFDANLRSGGMASIVSGKKKSRGIGGGSSSSSSSSKCRVVSQSIWSHLFVEMVSIAREKASNIQELEKALAEMGRPIGQRQLELCIYRSGDETMAHNLKTPVGALEMIQNVVWPLLFGYPCDGLEQSMSNERELFLICSSQLGHCPLTNLFVSDSPELGSFNGASFLAGMIEGILSGAGFHSVSVIAHDDLQSNGHIRTIFIVRF